MWYVVWNMCTCRCNYLHTSYTVYLYDCNMRLYAIMWLYIYIVYVPYVIWKCKNKIFLRCSLKVFGPGPLNLAGEGCVQNRIWIGGSMRCWEAGVVKRSLFIKALELPVRGFLEAYRKICESQRVKFCE